jgi:hypothetical protein
MAYAKINSVTNANMAKVSNVAKAAIGKIGNIDAPAASFNTYSLAFDGTNDYVNFGGETVTWDMGSLSFWMKSTDTSTCVPVYLNSSNPYQYVIFTSSIFGVRWPSHDGATMAQFNQSSYDYLDGNWHHFVITFERDGEMGGETTTTIYFDGTSVTTKNDTETYTPAARTLKFGVYGTTGFPLGGSLDEVAWWDARTLSADEVTELYNSGVPIALDSDSGNYVSSGNLTNWWRMGDGDTYSTIEDNTSSIDGTMTNMASDDIEEDVPG